MSPFSQRLGESRAPWEFGFTGHDVEVALAIRRGLQAPSGGRGGGGDGDD
jgi:hypothetical protein